MGVSDTMCVSSGCVGACLILCVCPQVVWGACLILCVYPQVIWGYV